MHPGWGPTTNKNKPATKQRTHAVHLNIHRGFLITVTKNSLRDLLKRCFVYLLLVYAIETVFQLYHDGDMMYEMRRSNLRNLEPPTLYRHGMTMRGTGFWWRCKLYTLWKWIAAQLNVMVVMGFVPLSPRSPNRCLTNWAICPSLGSSVPGWVKPNDL